MPILKWILWGVAIVIGSYLAILFLFALYFALASYLPLLARKVKRRLSARPDRPA